MSDEPHERSRKTEVRARGVVIVEIAMLAISLLLVGIVGEARCTKSQVDAKPLRPGVLSIEGSATPTERTQVSLEVTKLQGASVLCRGAHVESIEEEDPECDILRFTLKNSGEKPVSFWTSYDRTECPCYVVEAWIDGAWTKLVPYSTPDGRHGQMGPTACKYNVIQRELGGGYDWEFPIHIERWRFSVAEKLRISIEVVEHDPTAKLKEFVASNAFHVAH